VAREGKVWLILKVGMWDFKFFSKELFFWVVWDGVVGERGRVFFFFPLFVFCDLVI
jgi:hypothetical protein